MPNIFLKIHNSYCNKWRSPNRHIYLANLSAVYNLGNLLTTAAAVGSTPRSPTFIAVGVVAMKVPIKICINSTPTSAE